MGKAYVLESQEEWAEAKQAFENALVSLQDGEGLTKEQAREEAAWCMFKLGDRKNGKGLLMDLEAELAARKQEGERSLEQRARVLWKLGMCAWDLEPGEY